MAKKTNNLDKRAKMRVDVLSWAGTACMLGSPYLLSYPIGYLLGALGVVFITPQCYKNRQWNLLVLNVSSFIGYSLQWLEII
jgi:hypothetical protein